MSEPNFEWSQLGDVAQGRPNLGQTTTVEVYRMMQYSLRAVLEEDLGDDKTREILVRAGRVAGKSFCKEKMNVAVPLNKFFADLQLRFNEMAMGVLKIERSDPEKMKFVVTVSEDLDCSGLPVNGVTVCDYDEGFLAGVFEVYTTQPFEVHEIDCWSTGERTCRFTIEPEGRTAV
jgi:predicted hydrocarbon binding protein